MNRKTKRRVICGEANYKNLIKEKRLLCGQNGIYPSLEAYRSPIFLRPRRFGKSLMCTTLLYYYDINETESFEELFGQTNIGKNPTQGHNSYIVLSLDFSVIDPSESIRGYKISI